MRKLILLCLLAVPAQAQMTEPPKTGGWIKLGKSYFINLPGWEPHAPIPPACNSNDCAIDGWITVELDRRVKLAGLRAFVAFNKGDEFEAGFTVFADETVIYSVSIHKEVSSDYDAWRGLEDLTPLNVKAQRLEIHVRAQNHHPRQAGQPHFSLILYEK